MDAAIMLHVENAEVTITFSLLIFKPFNYSLRGLNPEVEAHGYEYKDVEELASHPARSIRFLLSYPFLCLVDLVGLTSLMSGSLTI